MYLFQKLNYTTKFLKELADFDEVESIVMMSNPKFFTFDTETTGLNIITDKPFLYSFGFKTNVYVFEPTKEMVECMIDLFAWAPCVFAHNAKFDYHMTWNLLGYEHPLLESRIADSFTVARLTSYADEQMSISLETLGEKYVDSTAKFAGKVIKENINRINRERKNSVKNSYYDVFGKKAKPFGKVWEDFTKGVCVQFVHEKSEEYAFIEVHFKEANYLDVYNEEKELMTCYAMDDCVILNEYLNKALPILMQVDEGFVTSKRENKLISVIARMEKNGMRIDIPYMVSSRKKIDEFRTNLYEELWELTGSKFSVGQHKVIIGLYSKLYGISLSKADKDALKDLKTTNTEALRVSQIITKLRTLDKWVSTYIDGKLNSVIDGKIYTDMNNSGAVSGRVSCNMQQQPKEALLDEQGNELFHPRRAFVTENDDYLLVFEDMSQMELRVQAYYTMLVGNGDVNMCRAYMPFNCKNFLTGELFDPKNDDSLKQWDDGVWVHCEDESKLWEPTDLHTVTTFTAFPHLNNDINHPEFKHYRKLGKMCNFLKNYSGGKNAIMEQLEVSEDIAQQLDSAYYSVFPEVKKHQDYVNRTLTTYGKISNLYGRTYFMKDSRFFYKVHNYLIQGSCADMMKVAEIKIDKLLKGKKSKFLLPIHDEVMLSIHKDEMELIGQVKAIMEDCKDVMPWVPMISEVEISSTNWADKNLYEEELWIENKS